MLILSSIAVISYQTLLQRHYANNVLNRVRFALRYARSSAFAEQAEIMFCGAKKYQCDGNWDQGQLIIRVKDHKILRVFSALPASIHLRFRSNFNKNSVLIFSPDGTTKGQQGRFEVLSANNEVKGSVIIIHSGRIRLQE